MISDDVACGITGTALGAVGTGLSVNEIQAIVSICVTVLSFFIGVLIPVIVKIVKKIKKAKEDGVITKEEVKEIKDTVIDGVKEVKDGIENIKQVSDKNQKKE